MKNSDYFMIIMKLILLATFGLLFIEGFKNMVI